MNCFSAGEYEIKAEPSLAKCKDEILPIGSYSSGNSNGGNHTIPAPNNNSIKANVHWMEEKGSDVNLACHLVNDAWASRFDAAAVISNDTDPAEPTCIVTQELNKPVVLLCPSRFGASQHLQNVASSVRHIHYNHLKTSQFPDPIPGTIIHKPASW